MKKYSILLIAVIFFFQKNIQAVNYVSVANGNWGTKTTWSPQGIPTKSDNVTIANAVTVNAIATALNITVNSGASLAISNSVSVYGKLTNNGTITGTYKIGFVTANDTILAGTGNWSGYSSILLCEKNNQIIAPGTNLVLGANASVELYTGGALANITVTNYGTVTISGTGRLFNNDPAAYAGVWVNGTNASLTVPTNPLTGAKDTLRATATGNTVTFGGTTSYIIRKPSSLTFYNLTLASTGTLSMPGALTISGNLTVSSGTFDVTGYNYNYTLGGNLTNNATLNNRANTVTLSGTAGQTLGGTSVTTFKNLIASGTSNETVTLGNAITITNNFTISGGTFDCQTYQVTGNATGLFSLAAGASLLLGTTASATNVSIPTLFTVGHTTFNITSNVEFLANTSAQTIPNTYTYGNVLVDGGAVTKTAAFPLTIGGNFTVNASPTFNVGGTLNVNGNGIINGTLDVLTGCTANITGTLTNSGTTSIGGTGILNVTGATTNSGTVSVGTGTYNETTDFTNSGTLSFSSGIMNIKGNFTNNGTLTAGTGTVNFTGTSTQTVGGSASTPFYDLTVNGAGINIASNLLSVTDALTPTAGTISNTAGDSLTMSASSSKTARIGVVSGTITAVFKMQQYFNRSRAQYCYWSSPSSNETLGDVNSGNRNPKFYMSGIGGPDGTSGTYVSVYKYDESTAAYNAITTYTSPGINYVFNPGEALLIWMGTGLSGMSPSVYRSAGVPNYGNVNIGITASGPSPYTGQNLIGNPYDSPIDWSAFYTANSGTLTSSSFYILEQDGSSHSFTSGSIPDNQGFSIIGSAGTLNFTESQKTSTAAAWLRPEGGNGDPIQAPNGITLTLANDANNYSCPTTVIFSSHYQQGFDGNEDAAYIESPAPLFNQVPQLFTIDKATGTHMIANRMPENNNIVDIPLGCVCPVTANYTMTINNVNRLISYSCITLLDGTTGQVIHNFTLDPSFTFTTTTAGESKNYVLRFSKSSSGCDAPSAMNSANNNNNIIITPSVNGANVNFYLAQPENAVISIYNMLGEKVCQDIQTSAYNNQYPLNLAGGGQLYVIKVQTNSGTTIKKIYR